MIHRCAWCGQLQRVTEPDAQGQQHETHGMCAACEPRVRQELTRVLGPLDE